MATATMERDPRNRGFQWRMPGAPYRLFSREQAQQYDELGFALVREAFDPVLIDSVIAAIDPVETRLEQRLRDEFGGRHSIARADAITFTVHLVTRSALLKRFSRHGVFARLCHDTVGLPARLYWDQAVYKKPGTVEEFPWHQDNGYTYVEPQQYLTCWVALTDATERNGCPWVVPGIHRMGTLAHRQTPLGLQCLTEPDNAIPVPARAGDIVVFSSLTPHRTGPNLTDAVRKAYILQYAPDGAVAFRPGAAPEPQCDPERQYPVAD